MHFSFDDAVRQIAGEIVLIGLLMRGMNAAKALDLVSPEIYPGLGDGFFHQLVRDFVELRGECAIIARRLF